jgi:hypothetical protein
VKRRAYCFQEIGAAAQPNKLSPAVIIGMPVGADTSPTDLAVIRARDMRAEVAGGIDLVATPSGEPHAGGGKCARHLWVRLGFPRTSFALGLAREARKGLEFALGLGRFRYH